MRQRHGEHLGVPRGVEEERVRDAVDTRGVAHPVRSRSVEATGHAFEHVAEIDDERAGNRRCGDPAVAAAHLEPAGVVLTENRDEPVVGVLADAPWGRVGGERRVAEDAEQHRGIRGEVAVEPSFVEIERA